MKKILFIIICLGVLGFTFFGKGAPKHEPVYTNGKIEFVYNNQTQEYVPKIEEGNNV